MELCDTYVPEDIVKEIFSYITLPNYSKVCRYLGSISRYLESRTYSLIRKRCGDSYDYLLETEDWESSLFMCKHMDKFPFGSTCKFAIACVRKQRRHLLSYAWTKFKLTPYTDGVLWMDSLRNETIRRGDFLTYDLFYTLKMDLSLCLDTSMLLHYDEDISRASLGTVFSTNAWSIRHVMKAVSTAYPRLVKAVLKDCKDAISRRKFTFDKREPLLLAMTLGSREIVEMISSY